MARLLTMVLTTTELDDSHFLATAVSHNFSYNLATFNERSTYFKSVACSNHQNFIEVDSSASLNVQLFQTNDLTFGHTVLFSAALEYRVHLINSVKACLLLKARHAQKPITMG
ncbi:hypothetical protein VO71_02000 [Aeromonas salmonicida subsp. smithia]|nr:hypothetical protein VO71_02000 [Aeromonas salmonicida subsp. smithia]